jgi:hypothetical protein
MPAVPGPATIDVADASGRVVARTTTGPDGRYEVPLPPGDYILRPAIGALFPRCPSVRVTIVRRSQTRADIACETGIR